MEESTTTWADFVTKCKKKFLKNRVAEAWREIKEIQQGDNQQVSEFIESLNSLFKTVNLTDDESKVSFFIASVNSSIGFELERNNSGSSAARTYEMITEEAIEVEKLQKKYRVRGNINSNTNNGIGNRVGFQAVDRDVIRIIQTTNVYMLIAWLV